MELPEHEELLPFAAVKNILPMVPYGYFLTSLLFTSYMVKGNGM
jgi:hypothetical protein